MIPAEMTTPATAAEISQIRLWTLEEVAAHTGYALRTLQLRCRADEIEHQHMGRQRRMTTEQVQKLTAEHRVVPAKQRALDPEIARIQRLMDRRAAKRQQPPAAA